MLKGIKKINIIGGMGTGKTTLANRISEELKIPVCYMDALNYGANWKVKNQKKRDKKILQKIKEPTWIMDGTYLSTLENRLKAGDLTIYLDYSTWAQLKGSVGRYLKNHGKEKPEVPGCKDKMTLSFFLWIFRWKRHNRKQIIELINKADKNKIVILKNRKQLRKWFKEMFDKEMEIK